MANDEKEEVDVRREDQEKIGLFGVNTNKILELQRAKAELQKELDGLEDAEQEVMLADGVQESFHLRIAGVFVKTEDEAEFSAMIDSRREGLTTEQESLAAQIVVLEREQDILKKDLYGRFGDQINLEY